MIEVIVDAFVEIVVRQLKKWQLTIIITSKIDVYFEFGFDLFQVACVFFFLSYFFLLLWGGVGVGVGSDSPECSVLIMGVRGKHPSPCVLLGTLQISVINDILLFNQHFIDFVFIFDTHYPSGWVPSSLNYRCVH